MRRIMFLVIALLLVSSPATAQEEQQKQQAQPPAKVVTAKAETGFVSPQTVFVGSVYFPEVSETASEVSGRVVKVGFDEGDHVKAGQMLAKLDTSLAQRSLAAMQASYQQAQASLERARLDLNRMDELFSTESVSEKEFDDARFEVMELEKNAESIMADVERLKLEIEKADIRAPFDGVVLEKLTARGEWLSAGSPVATLARNDMIDVVVDVPQDIFLQAKPGTRVLINVAGQQEEGEILAAIPKGDVSTRTFPVKIRVANTLNLAEGMQATVHMPSGQEVESIIVPRDAVILSQGQNVLFLAKDGQAALVPVTVHSFMKDTAAVSGPGLAAGADVVIKGQERLRPGQPVQLIGQQ